MVFTSKAKGWCPLTRKSWREATLGDEIELLTGFPFESKYYTESPNGIRLVRGDNVVQAQIRWEGVKRWPKDQTTDLAQYFLSPGDVVLAMDRPWIEAGLKYACLTQDDTPALLVQRVARLRGRANLHTAFLRYVIGSPAFTQHVQSVQTGTAVPHISGSQIRQFKFRLPPLSEQRAIAGVLGALDDKIEVNRKTARVLEGIARAVFTSWFVDFDPVRRRAAAHPGPAAPLPADLAALFPTRLVDSPIGEVPEGWRVGTLGEVIEAVGGGTPSTGEPAFWEGGTHAFCTPKDMSSLTAPVLLSTERRVTDAGLAKINSGLLPPGTVVMSSRAPIGYLAITEIPVAVNQGIIAMKCTRGWPASFVLRWCEAHMDQIEANANGSTFQEISKTNFRPIATVLPDPAVVAAFDRVAAPLHRRVVACERQSATLAALRDALLPNLISGELRIADAEKIVGRSA
jgi:type I restriction enzyme S subunit